MVPRKTQDGAAVADKISRSLTLILVGIFSATIVAVLLVLIGGEIKDKVSDNTAAEDVFTEIVDEESAEEIAEKTEVELPKQIDFQPVIDEWVQTVEGSKSVIVYDIERKESVGSYNLGQDFETASLYKLFVVYEGYRRLETGEWTSDMEVGGTGYDMLECLDLAIRESYSPCAEAIWGMIGHEELENIIQRDFGIENSHIAALVSNAEDILKMMLLFYEHPDFNKASFVDRMKDSFLNQPPTTYNWRQGLPSGFAVANVYNKTGWRYNGDSRKWDVYDDAAIIEFPEEGRHFAMVVLTSGVDYARISELGGQIEAYYIAQMSS